MMFDLISRPKIIPQGTKIICAHCGEHVLTLLRERTSYDTIMAEDFEVNGDIELKNGDDMVCWFCSKEWWTISDDVFVPEDGGPCVLATPKVSGGIR